MASQPAIRITDPTKVAAEYNYWRLRVFYSIYVGYVLFYFTRKSFTFAMPSLIDDLGFTKADLGILGSLLYITYGLSKFVSGMLSDKANPRYFMATGLILTGVLNVAFGFSSTLWLFALIWCCNGFFQGWGWPPCTKQLTHWFSQSERGFWWSVHSTSHNVGGALIPLLVAFIAADYGWRWSMIVPGMIAVVAGFWLINRLCDVPVRLGLPPIEEFRNEPLPATSQSANSELSFRQILFQEVLPNRAVWLLAFAYFFVYVVRTAINDWTPLYLVQVKQYELIPAAAAVTWFEVGGFFGCIFAGWGSDYFYQGRRTPIMVVMTIALTAAALGYWVLPIQGFWLDQLILALLGFLVFGPQTLVGLAAAELVDKKAACTANGFAGCFAYLGAAATGYPLGKIIDVWGWESFFGIVAFCSLVILFGLIPLGNRENAQFQEASEEEEFQPTTAAG